MKRPFLTAVAALGTLGLALSACSPSTGNKSSESSAASSGDQATVTFRLWDDVAAPAYEESFKAFEEKNPGIKVKVEVVPWGDYWTQLPLDISSGEMADIFWVNSSNFALYADNGNLMNITKELGKDHDAWQQSVVDLYTRNDSLWGIPQIWDSIGLFYNKDLVTEAGVDVTKLTWGTADDTLLPALQKLTKDANGKTADAPDFDAANIKTYGMNAQADMQAIYLPFLAQAGGLFQKEDGSFDFASDKGVMAFTYITDLINKYHVAPPAAETNTNGDLAREMFIRGEMALFQSGPYSLKTIADNTKINWGIAPLISGPEGAVSTSHGVVAVGNEQTKNREATLKVLKWLGSAESQAPLGKMGVSFPGAVDAQDYFVNYWADKGVDVSVFIDAAAGKTALSPFGPDVNAGTEAFMPRLLDVFLGSVPVEQGLKEAQDAGNSAMK
ncbi:sugar ABC transporter substrate-binding protein [Trueperella pecoris]|uniref:Sugar ABC transporter substrate-binding protein n=1 Tax=Trueperella pecoris TaxID=2733571 RepID=A0A7M1R0R6_9ACTO|nr:sugar ABC transporter substrate-binding protein [Trueperella pecoris]QOR47778.1 sugar ABC transporter substrate-binding protein [Trueperella pecoris]